MLTLAKTKEGSALTVALEGRLDTNTAPQLDEAIKSELPELTSLVLDFEKLVYISSAGLRVLLSAQKVMNRQGVMIVCHVQPGIMEIFDVTGFSEMLNIEE